MANKIKVLFWVHRTKTNKLGQAPLMLRLSYQNSRAQKATGYYVKPDDWNITKQCVRGNSESANKINDWIQERLVKINDLYREADKNSSIHLTSFISKLFVEVTEEPFLLKLIAEYNEEMRVQVNKGFSNSTYEKYLFTYDKVKAFIKKKLKKDDILLKELDIKFIIEFDRYLRVHDNNQHNTAVKYCINLKRVLNVAVIRGIIEKSPFNAHKTVFKDTIQVYLDELEVLKIESASLIKPKHLLTRDLFLFQCSTGLAYTDLISLSLKDVSTDSLGRKWIVKARQKSGVVSTIPLLPKALEIIDKYNSSNNPNNCLFPHYSIQKYNEYIAEIGELSGIHKRLSSHVGRRTFGNVALSRGISLNVISKILGHTNTLITQRVYAITTQTIITAEIEKW